MHIFNLTGEFCKKIKVRHVSFILYFEGSAIKVMSFVFKDVETLVNISLTKSELLHHDHHGKISVSCSFNLMALSFNEN